MNNGPAAWPVSMAHPVLKGALSALLGVGAHATSGNLILLLVSLFGFVIKCSGIK